METNQWKTDFQDFIITDKEWLGAKNILGTAKSGIRMIGRANEFANKIGVSSPMDESLNSLEYGQVLL